MTNDKRQITIIGCGNLNRSDDAVGVIVAQRLQH
ncbi:hydrogenase maturation protease, partial [Fischerella thermalis CCMEE 5319]